MTDWHDVVRAVSLTRVHEWGTEVQVLLALTAEPAPGGEVKVCLGDLAHDTGLGTGQVSRAIGKLIGRRVIARDSGRGQESSSYWIRPPNEWGRVPWRVERRAVGTIIDASLGLHARARDQDSSRAWARERRRSVNGKSASATWVARAPGRASYSDLARAPGRASYDHPCTSSSGIDEDHLFAKRVTGSELGKLPDRQRLLAEAWFRGTGVQYFAGGRLVRLLRLAEECNGELDRLVAIAADPRGPASWDERLAQLEEAMSTPPVQEAARQEYSSEEARLERHVAQLQAAGLEEEAEEALHRLATLRSCRQGSAL